MTFPRACPALALLLLPASLFLGCKADPVEISLDVSLSELIPTVGMATFSTEAEGVTQAWVEATLDGAEPRVFPATLDGGTWSARLLGLKASTVYTVEAVVVIEEEEHRDGATDVQTGQAPDVIPSMQVEVVDPDNAIEGFLFTALQAGWAMPVVLDTDGDIVWWHYPSDEQEVVNRGTPLRDGSGVIYTRNESQTADLVKVSWDGTEEVVVPVPLMNHDYVELPDGTVAYIAYDPLVIEDQLVYGDAIMELSPDGVVSRAWTVYDTFEFDPDFEIPAGTTWTHANALDYDEASDDYYVGIRNFDTILRIDRSTGQVVERIGGDDSDYATAAGDTQLFNQQHQFTKTADDRILVFDNGEEEGERTSAREYLLDAERGTAEEIFRYQTDPSLYCFSLGDVIRLEGGDTIVVWSTAGQVDQVDAEGNLRWRMNGGIGAAFGYSTFRERFLGD